MPPKIGVKNRRKIDPGEPPGLPKWTQNRCRERLWGDQSAQGAPSDGPERPPCAPRSPRERLESPQERPRAPGRAPGSAQECFGPTKIDAEAPPGAKKAMFCARHICAPFRDRFFDNFYRFLAFSQNAKTLRCTATARQNQGSALRLVRRSARTMRP